ncbi:hypothetical protein PAXINDRAFT_158293 [Paxillus involutus ATCC 200175]|uniref:Uncharacterized protein n=1 Tax=Paxillus involutus ATCC 200175 TaxID=664439 RepID=A0A0C9SNG0_PAXIN|nr:hypothetical protein PAXINDRAFT_158293 [Paxillus involutus ATCC 200175]
MPLPVGYTAQDYVYWEAYAGKFMSFLRGQGAYPGDPPLGYEEYKKREKYTPTPDKYKDIIARSSANRFGESLDEAVPEPRVISMGGFEGRGDRGGPSMGQGRGCGFGYHGARGWRGGMRGYHGPPMGSRAARGYNPGGQRGQHLYGLGRAPRLQDDTIQYPMEDQQMAPDNEQPGLEGPGELGVEYGGEEEPVLYDKDGNALQY